MVNCHNVLAHCPVPLCNNVHLNRPPEHCWHSRHLTHECVLCQQHRGELQQVASVCIWLLHSLLPAQPCDYRADYQGRPALCSSSFEVGLFSWLYLFNKAETYSFGVRPASLIALIIDSRWGSFSARHVWICNWVCISGSRVCKQG